MSAPMKKHRTENSVLIEIGNSRKRFFSVPSEKTKGIIVLLKEYEVEEKRDWRKVLEKDLSQSSESAIALKGVRIRDGLSQKELAKLLDISQSLVAQIENGKREITKDVAKRLGEIFNVGYKVFL